MGQLLQQPTCGELWVDLHLVARILHRHGVYAFGLAHPHDRVFVKLHVHFSISASSSSWCSSLPSSVANFGSRDHAGLPMSADQTRPFASSKHAIVHQALCPVAGAGGAVRVVRRRAGAAVGVQHGGRAAERRGCLRGNPARRVGSTIDGVVQPGGARQRHRRRDLRQVDVLTLTGALCDDAAPPAHTARRTCHPCRPCTPTAREPARLSGNPDSWVRPDSACTTGPNVLYSW